jgi:hypothetical protein
MPVAVGVADKGGLGELADARPKDTKGYLVSLGGDLVQYTYLRRVDKKRRACNFTLSHSFMGKFYPALCVEPGLISHSKLQLQIRVPAAAEVAALAAVTGPESPLVASITAERAVANVRNAKNGIVAPATAVGGTAADTTLDLAEVLTATRKSPVALAVASGTPEAVSGQAAGVRQMEAAAASPSRTLMLPCQAALQSSVGGGALAVVKAVDVQWELRRDRQTWMLNGAEQVLADLHGWRMVFLMKVRVSGSFTT